jgi:hypothetical protein
MRALREKWGELNTGHKIAVVTLLFTALSAVAAVLGLWVNAAFLGATAPEDSLVVVVEPSRFRVPSGYKDARMERCDQIRAAVESALARNVEGPLLEAIALVIDQRCKEQEIVPIGSGFTYEISMWNEGKRMVEDVSVRITGVFVAEWRRSTDSGKSRIVVPPDAPWSNVTIDVGNLRPSERAYITAWVIGEDYVRKDDVAVFQAGGRSSIVWREPKILR